MGQNYRFKLLAPPEPSVEPFGRTRTSQQVHRQYLAEMQRLRGRVYLKDGAIQACEMESDGRFVMRGDEQGWHLLLVDDDKQVIGCARYLVHPNTVSYDSLRISHCTLAKDPKWGPLVKAAVERDLAIARERDLAYIEIGGWALAEEWRGTRAALEVLVGSYALAHLWGGALGACTATVRHASSSMLRRIGGTPLAVDGIELPAYDDPQYDCQMELLHFDCQTPSPRFSPLVAQLKSKLSDLVAITPHDGLDWKLLPEWGRLGLLRMVPVAC